MLKKRVLKRLLPLLFSFCFVFSGFLSVDAFAYSSIDFTPFNAPMQFSFLLSNNTAPYSLVDAPHETENNVYFMNNSDYSNLHCIAVQKRDGVYAIPPLVDNFKYYLVGSVYAGASNISEFTFFPTVVNVNLRNHNNVIYDGALNTEFYHIDTQNNFGFSFVTELDIVNASGIDHFNIRMHESNLSVSGSIPNACWCQFSILAVHEDTSEESLQAIVSAINNQTSQLGSDIGQAADDVQQSIEDQYSGDPETEFSVDDVITQHNEKMGVLSFGSDVMLQFLDMFQSANVGTAELTLPGFNITVENVEYSVWPDYSFNFEQLNEWVPALMSVIRVMLPAFVWLMVLRYCINVFEKNFLSNGG